MYCSDLRKARIYDRLEGHERLEVPRRRFAEVDGAAESLRPGAVVALAFDCDELLAARRNTESGQWSLATTATEWSSRGERRVRHPAGPALAGGAAAACSPQTMPPADRYTAACCLQVPLAGTLTQATMLLNRWSPTACSVC
jgi:hypothetical protein